MKAKFSTAWKGSRQTRKQRKYLANAPIHIKKKIVASHLSKELRKKYGRRSFPLRKDDKVKVMNGEFKGKSGKVTIIDMKKLRACIEGLQITKKDGSKINAWFNTSNLMIEELSLDDKMRLESINRKSESKELKKQEKN